jgi:hypothetical protein
MVSIFKGGGRFFLKSPDSLMVFALIQPTKIKNVMTFMARDEFSPDYCSKVEDCSC